jgi:hypothetical protein
VDNAYFVDTPSLDDVTVVIPFKNGGNEAWLKQAIVSLPPKIKYLVARNDGELAEALNSAVEQADAEYVFRLDADDTLRPGCIEFLRAMVWDVDVTYPSLLITDQFGKVMERRKAAAYDSNRLFVNNYIPGCALMRRKVFLEVGGYRDMPFLEDWDLWVRMAKEGKSFKGVKEALYVYRQHGVSRNSMKREDHEESRRVGEQIILGGDRIDLKASFYYQASYATTYVRCLPPARYLPGQAVDHAAAFIRDVDGEDPELFFPEHRGTAVYQFPGDAVRAVQMAHLQDQGVRVLVETDDTYLEMGPLGNPGWQKNIREKNGGTGHSLEAHKKIIPWVDGIIVTTEHLGKRYRKYNEKIYVCPNQIDPVDWPEPAKSEDEIRVGWCASNSHVKDAPLVKRALKWASEQDGVKVFTMGFDPGWTDFERFHVPWSNDMGVYRHVIGTWDIGMAPLKEDPWSVCRSDLKALEYGVSGVWPILSDTIPYQGYEGPCDKVKGSKGLYMALRGLLTHRDELRDRQTAVRDYVLRERTMAKNIHKWAEAIEG